MLNGQVDGDGGRGGGFGEVRHIAVLADGSVLATEHGWHEIRRAIPGSSISSVVGVGAKVGFADGAGPAALLNRHAGLGHDGSDGIWVADFFHNRLRRLRLDLKSCGALLGSSPQNAALSCAAWQAASKAQQTNQVFIDPDPKDATPPFATQCNTVADGGG